MTISGFGKHGTARLDGGGADDDPWGCEDLAGGAEDGGTDGPVAHFAADFEVMADDGCEFAPSCLACPLPRCKYDDPEAARRWQRAPRNQQILAAFEAGETVPDLVARFGVSRRTVYRAIGEARHHPVPLGRRVRLPRSA